MRATADASILFRTLPYGGTRSPTLAHEMKQKGSIHGRVTIAHQGILNAAIGLGLHHERIGLAEIPGWLETVLYGVYFVGHLPLFFILLGSTFHYNEIYGSVGSCIISAILIALNSACFGFGVEGIVRLRRKPATTS